MIKSGAIPDSFQSGDLVSTVLDPARLNAQARATHEQGSGQNVQAGLGLRISRTADGARLSAKRPKPMREAHPFKVNAFLDAGTWKYVIRPGSFHSMVPASLTGTLGTGDRAVYLKIGATVTATARGYIHLHSFTSLTTIANAGFISTPQGPFGPGAVYFYVLLADFTDGQKNGQYITSSLDGRIWDSGNLESKGVLTLDL